MVPGHFEEIDHTADTGVHVTAGSLAGLIETATVAMFTLMYGAPEGGAEVKRTLEVEGESPTDLMWAWLSDALSWGEADAAVYWHAEVAVDEGRARGSLAGVPTRGREAVGPAIKAVTYHGLCVEPREGLWETTIIFDV